MKCHDASAWLLTVESPAALPAEILRHVEECATCRRLHQRLLRLERGLGKLPVPAADSELKSRFVSQIGKWPLPDRIHAPRRGSWADHLFLFRTKRSSAALCGTLVLLLAVAAVWFGVTRQKPDDANAPGMAATGASPQTSSTRGSGGEEQRFPSAADNPRNEQAVTQAADRELSLIGRSVNSHVRLAVASSPRDQLWAMTDLASALWGEVVYVVEQDPSDKLLVLRQLYALVLERGLLGRAKALPAEDRDELRQVVQQLNETELDTERVAAQTLPAIAQVVRGMGATARDTARRLSSSRELEQSDLPHLTSTGSKAPAANGDLLTTVVRQTVFLAEEDDPLRRADHCNEVAEQLAQVIVLSAARGRTAQAATLGTCLGDVVEQGAATNLARFIPTGENDPRRGEFERIRQRSTRAAEVLKQNLDDAPAPARVGLERALSASQRGRGKAAKPGNGKPHPPGRPPNFVPPGLRDSGRSSGPGQQIPPGHRKEQRVGKSKREDETRIDTLSALLDTRA